jgi:hypothetical protein
MAIVGGKLQNHKPVCISMYIDDIVEMDELIIELKKKGFTRANRSWLIRMAMKQFDNKLLPDPRYL